MNHRRRLRFSLRALLLITAVIAVWLASHGNLAQKQRAAIAAIERLGGTIVYEDNDYMSFRRLPPDSTPPGVKWMRQLFGEQQGPRPVEIQLYMSADKAPERFTDNEAKLVGTLTELEWLVLMDTGLTDAGLMHFRNLRRLNRLDVEGTAVTERGAKELQKYLPNVRVYFDPTADD